MAKPVQWYNMKCDGTIETYAGNIPRRYHTAVTAYADVKCQELANAVRNYLRELECPKPDPGWLAGVRLRMQEELDKYK